MSVHVKAVHRDVHGLLNAGVLDRTDDGRIHFPYSAVRVDFTLHKEVAYISPNLRA